VPALSPIDTALLSRLREALDAAGYRYDAVTELLGPTAHAALGRNETTPGLRATRDGGPLATLVRLWPLQAPVSSTALESALAGLLPELLGAGLVEKVGDQVRALVDVRPYASEAHDWFVLSDLTPGLDGRPNRVEPDHVLGLSSASTSLAQLTVREPVGAALDLGTGCGVQALHLSDHADRVVATDVNTRALVLARATADVNGVRLDVREGSLFEPVASERFDLVVTNPPFVVSPPDGDRLVYRDSGLPGDEVVRRVVAEAPGHLAPGGVAQVLANWVHVAGQPWEERLTRWLDDTGCDAWVVQREVADPAEYVELWLRDAGRHHDPDYTRRYDAWLGWLEDQGVVGVGFGWLTLRRTERQRPVVRIEDWPHAVEQPLGTEIGSWLRRVDTLGELGDRDVLTTAWRRRDDISEETVGEPGAADPEVIVLRQQRGMRRARRVDTLIAAVVGASDGELTLHQILRALSDLLDQPVEQLVATALPEVRALVDEGFLHR
jgi:methylase of polypeptide subunit release factors